MRLATRPGTLGWGVARWRAVDCTVKWRARQIACARVEHARAWSLHACKREEEGVRMVARELLGRAVYAELKCFDRLQFVEGEEGSYDLVYGSAGDKTEGNKVA